MNSNILNQLIPAISFKTKGEQAYAVIAIGYLSCLMISFELWFPVENIFPVVPVINELGEVPVFITIVISSLMLSFLYLSLFHRFKQRLLITMTIVLTFVLVPLDVLRLQPWVFYFSSMLLTYSFFPANNEDKIITILAVIMAGIYFWSGVQKFNYTFINETFIWLIEPVYKINSAEIPIGFKTLAFIAALIECTSGALLITKRHHRKAAIVLMGMHFFILTVLGPFGHTTNTVTWPWNIAFIILLYILFIKKDHSSDSSLLTIKNTAFSWGIFAVFWILPALSFPGFWPKNLSSALYSGNKARATIYLSEDIVKQLPDNVKTHVNEYDYSIMLNTWSQKELGVAIYPNSDVHRRIFKKLCHQYSESSYELVLESQSEPDLLTGEKQTNTLFCDEPDN